MKLSLGFSTCPNDTFIFDAMVNGKIDTYGIEFEVIMTDVEELNHLVINQKIDISKLSFHTLGYVMDKYKLLNAGSALGFGCGPLLISNDILPDFSENPNYSIGIPGKNTTANFLFNIFYPNHTNKKILVFHEIENQLLDNSIDAGVIIHENRFTYQSKGLHKITDLGEKWETSTSFPIPLGGIAINRQLDIEIQRKIDLIMKNSVSYAFENQDNVMGFVEKYAQEMDKHIMKQHIDLYVNEFTKDLGEKGRAAINYFINIGIALNIFEKTEKDLFV